VRALRLQRSNVNICLLNVANLGDPSMPARKHYPFDDEYLAFARNLRRSQTDAELFLWKLVRNRQFLGLKFRRQHPIGPYFLDFYCDSKKLAIELDGGQHNDPAERLRDERRSTILSQHGIRVVRIWNHEMFKETEAVLQLIYDRVMESDSAKGTPLA
jgi:very-short-patch-repair endonuclease